MLKNSDEDADENYSYSMTITDEEGYQTINYYDKNNLLVLQKTTPDNETFYLTKYEYDLNGNKIKEMDPKGNQTEYIYD